MPRYDFASDNTAGICPEAWDALDQARHGHTPGYGDDAFTQRACDHFRDVFETDCDIYFTFNGTAANSLALASMAQPYHSVIVHRLAHTEQDECNAPAFFSGGLKMLLGHGDRGKLTPDAVDQLVTNRSDIHYPKPRIISLTQPTELGAVYTVDELAALTDAARRHDLRVHVDGARFAHAVARLDRAPADLTWRLGVDVLCFGGTKLGLPVGDAVVFFNRQLSAEFAYRCKQAGQLASKMRILSAPWIGMLQDGAWLRHARHANAMADRLAAGVDHAERNAVEQGAGDLAPRRELPSDANAVFVHLHHDVDRRLQDRGWRYYDFIGGAGARWMCSWATPEALVDQLLGDLRDAIHPDAVATRAPAAAE